MREIKKEIEHFRSEALMSRYQSAINSGNKLLQKLGLLQKVLEQDFSQIQKEIKMELDYCSQLSKFMFGDKQKQNFQNIPKKNEEIKIEGIFKTSENKKWKSLSVNQLKNESHVQKMYKIQEAQEEVNVTVEQRLHKNLILPLNMPIFKLKSSIFIIKTKNCLNEVLEYLIHYDFKHFPSVDLCDLGVQNIVNFKEEMQKMGQKRAVIALQKESLKFGFSKKEIEKLKNIVNVFRETNETGKIQKDAVLALIVEEQTQENLSEKSSFLKGSESKSVKFE